MIYFLGSEKVVLKFGTNSLVRDNRNRINRDIIHAIAEATSCLYSAGKKPLIVTSGAVAAGMEINRIYERPTETVQLQNLSAEGARLLWQLYADAFREYGIGTIYIPVTWHLFEADYEQENLRRIAEYSWHNSKIVLLNTNDALTNEELVRRSGSINGFSDNDILAALASECIAAGTLVFFTDAGIMGTGGGYSKSIALQRASDKGIKTGVYSITELEGLSKSFNSSAGLGDAHAKKG